MCNHISMVVSKGHVFYRDNMTSHHKILRDISSVRGRSLASMTEPFWTPEWSPIDRKFEFEGTGWYNKSSHYDNPPESVRKVLVKFVNDRFNSPSKIASWMERNQRTAITEALSMLADGGVSKLFEFNHKLPSKKDIKEAVRTVYKGFFGKDMKKGDGYLKVLSNDRFWLTLKIQDAEKTGVENWLSGLGDILDCELKRQEKKHGDDWLIAANGRSINFATVCCKLQTTKNSEFIEEITKGAAPPPDNWYRSWQDLWSFAENRSLVWKN